MNIRGLFEELNVERKAMYSKVVRQGNCYYICKRLEFVKHGTKGRSFSVHEVLEHINRQGENDGRVLLG